MHCKDFHVVLWGRKLICQRPFRGSQNTWTGPVSVSAARCSPLTCSAYILACAVLCLLFRCCCFYCCCTCVNTYNMITHLISTCRLETLRREQVEREERSCPQTDTCVCVCVCECVFACVCVEGANCAWRGLLWFSASTAPSPSINTYSNPHVKRAAHLFAFSLRQTLVGYAHLREPREPRQENREPCSENRVPCVIHNNSKPYVKHNILRAIHTQISFQIRNLCFQLECLKNCATNTK